KPLRYREGWCTARCSVLVPGPWAEVRKRVSRQNLSCLGRHYKGTHRRSDNSSHDAPNPGKYSELPDDGAVCAGNCSRSARLLAQLSYPSGTLLEGIPEWSPEADCGKIFPRVVTVWQVTLRSY